MCVINLWLSTLAAYRDAHKFQNSRWLRNNLYLILEGKIYSPTQGLLHTHTHKHTYTHILHFFGLNILHIPSYCSQYAFPLKWKKPGNKRYVHIFHENFTVFLGWMLTNDFKVAQRERHHSSKILLLCSHELI